MIDGLEACEKKGNIFAGIAKILIAGLTGYLAYAIYAGHI